MNFLSPVLCVVLWNVFLQSCPCQKQPSTKTAILFEGKTKSGLPNKRNRLRHLVTKLLLKILISLSSVDLLPDDLTDFMIRERSSSEKVSIVSTFAHVFHQNCGNELSELYRNGIADNLFHLGFGAVQIEQFRKGLNKSSLIRR